MADQRTIAALRPNPLNPRTAIEEDETFAELVTSVRMLGVLQPILITPRDIIVAGHRRWLAARQAGLKHVPVTVRDLSESEQIQAMLAENIQRRALNPVEIARACKALLDRGLTPDLIAEKIGIARLGVTKHMAVLDLPAEVQNLLAAGSMPLGYVLPLAEIKHNAAAQVRIATRASKQGWHVNQVMGTCRAYLSGEKPPRIKVVEGIPVEVREKPREPSADQLRAGILASVRWSLATIRKQLSGVPEFRPYVKRVEMLDADLGRAEARSSVPPSGEDLVRKAVALLTRENRAMHAGEIATLIGGIGVPPRYIDAIKQGLLDAAGKKRAPLQHLGRDRYQLIIKPSSVNGHRLTPVRPGTIKCDGCGAVRGAQASFESFKCEAA